ncbi:MAG: sigma-70 family RNA polymerase sigma factor [Bacteroidota bacterium]
MSLGNEQDTYFAKQVVEGDKKAFSYFVKNYQQMAFAIAFKILRDEDLAKDAVQNAFVNAFRRIKSYKGDAKFSTWLYRITINDALKLAKKERKYTSFLNMDIPENTEAVFNEAVTKIAVNESKRKVNDVLKRMKPKEALVLQLFYLKEMSISEIEEVTRLKKSNIKVLLHRARKSFMYYFNKK